jgi:MFS family permease
MGLSSLAATIVNIALPALADALSSPLQQVQWILLAYLICVTALVVVAGRLADIVGPKRLLKAGILLFTLGSGLCAAAPDLELLVAARAVQGAGAAIMTALSLALVGAGAPKDRIGSAMGMLGGVAALGTALGPVLGGALLAGFGWRALFLVNLPLGLLAFLLASRHLPDDAPPAAGGWKRFDFAGALLLGSSLTAYALAMTPGRGGFGAASGALASAAALLFGLFLVAQAKTATPLVRLALLRDRTVGPGLAMSAVVMTVLMATLVVGPFYLARGLGLGPALTGLVLSTGPAVAALAGVPAGRLVDRYGARAAALAGLVAVGAGCLLLSLAPPTLGAGAYAGPIALVTAGYALFQAGNNSAVMAEAAPGERGVVSGMLTLSRNLGLITGASAMAALFGLASGVSDLAAAPAEAVVAGFRTTMAVGALLAFGALILSLASHLRDPRREFGVT